MQPVIAVTGPDRHELVAKTAGSQQAGVVLQEHTVQPELAYVVSGTPTSMLPTSGMVLVFAQYHMAKFVTVM
jgi:hypothetical protein